MDPDPDPGGPKTYCEQPEEAVEEAAVVQCVGGLAVLEAAAEGAAAA
jgi:hypothetical protein